jgi:hypothetical protein
MAQRKQDDPEVVERIRGMREETANEAGLDTEEGRVLDQLIVLEEGEFLGGDRPFNMPQVSDRIESAFRSFLNKRTSYLESLAGAGGP